MHTSSPTAAELARLQSDLSTLRDASGIGLPFGKEVVRFWLVIAASSAVVAASVAFGSAAYRLAALGLFALVGAALLAGVIVHLIRIGRRRGEDPAVWREYRQITLMKGIVLPFVIAFFAWQAAIGAPAGYLASTAVFFVGVVTLVYGVSTWARRPAVGLALPLIFYSAAIPTLAAERLLLLGTIAVTLGALGFAAILSWQLRRMTPEGTRPA